MVRTYTEHPGDPDKPDAWYLLAVRDSRTPTHAELSRRYHTAVSGYCVEYRTRWMDLL